MEYNEMIEESTEEYVEEESTEDSVEEESSEELVEEESIEESAAIDYDRLETMIESANERADLDTFLNSLAVTDVLMIILAVVLGIIIVRGRE